MKVAILYSGGKDSTLAIEEALKKGWEIKYLISAKPTRTDCYLFHFATVEQTKQLAKILGLKHILITCAVADPKKEAALIKAIIEKNPVDALVLGGTGLQKTQIGSLQKALFPKTEVFAMHDSLDHEEILLYMLNRGYEIIISQIASDGLHDWLGKTLTQENFNDFRLASYKYGFHIGGEGGYYDTLVCNAPFFKKRLVIKNAHVVRENKYCGFLEVKEAIVEDKEEFVLAN